MIKYDSVIDVKPYFNTYLYEDYIENNRSDIAYDIVGRD